MKDSHRIGLEMEDLAARYLEYKGYTVLERRYRSRMGEIDLIAAWQDLLVFVEVKFRKNLEGGRPSLTVTPLKQQKIRKTALVYWQHYCQRKNGTDVSCRFDVIELWQENGKYKVHHYKNAFEGEQNGI